MAAQQQSLLNVQNNLANALKNIESNIITRIQKLENKMGVSPNLETNIVDKLRQSDELSTLYELLDNNKLLETLKNKSNFTLLAPNNKAFDDFLTSFDTSVTKSRIAAAIDDFLSQTGAPGASVAILRPSGTNATEPIYVARGVREVNGGAIAPSDYVKYASITKPLTSAVILQLVDEGLIALDAPVSTYLGSGWAAGYQLDGVDYGDAITIQQILQHTDGFAEYPFDPGFYEHVSTRLDTPMEPEEIIAWAVAQGPLFVPGTDYKYNTVGHVVAGLVIEKVTGRSAHVEMRTRLFDPANATAIYLQPQEAPPDEAIAGYIGGLLKLLLEALPAFAPYAAAGTVGDLIDVGAFPQAILDSAGWTGGGIEAQADAMARAFRYVFRGALSEGMLAEFATPTTLGNENYGFGIRVYERVDGHTVFSHGGGVPGSRSHARYLPDLDLTIVVNANLIPITPDIDALASAVTTIMIDDLSATQRNIKPDKIVELLLSHVIDSKVLSSNLVDGQKVETLGPLQLIVRLINGEASFESPGSTAKVLVKDVLSSKDAVHHVIDTVLHDMSLVTKKY